jgi:hypothetical protein
MLVTQAIQEAEIGGHGMNPTLAKVGPYLKNKLKQKALGTWVRW